MGLQLTSRKKSEINNRLFLFDNDQCILENDKCDINYCDSWDLLIPIASKIHKLVEQITDPVFYVSMSELLYNKINFTMSKEEFANGLSYIIRLYNFLLQEYDKRCNSKGSSCSNSW